MPGRAAGVAAVAGVGAPGLLQETGRGGAGLQQEPGQARQESPAAAQGAAAKVRKTNS